MGFLLCWFSLLLQRFSAFPQFSIFGTIPKAIFLLHCLLHSCFTVSEQPFSANQISLKWKGFSRLVGSTIFGTMSKGQWSDVLQVKWCTIDLPNLNSHSFFAKLLSSLPYGLPISEIFFPCKWIAFKPHIYETTFIHGISEQLHFEYDFDLNLIVSLSPSKFFWNPKHIAKEGWIENVVARVIPMIHGICVL